MMTTPDAAAVSTTHAFPALYYRDGRPFAGRPTFQDAERGVYITQEQHRCGRCGGAGGSDQWKHTGWTCYECAGTGRGKVHEVKLYTADKLVKLNASQAKRDAKRAVKAAAVAAERQAQREANAARFDATHGALIARVANDLGGIDDATLAELVFKGRQYGSWSDNQLAFATSIVERLEAKRHAADVSNHVGTIGDRLDVAVTVTRVGSFERSPYMASRWSGHMETVHVITMADAAGNQIVSKSPRFRASVGDAFTLRATVKAHDTYQGIRQTIVTRASAKE